MATHTLPACEDLLAFIDSSPTPFHAADAPVARLGAAGFGPLLPTASWSELRPGRYYTPVGDGAIIAFIIPESARSGGSKKAAGPGIRGFRLVGAHTDSPNLRLGPRP